MGQQWLNSLGGAKEGGAARKGRGFKAPARAKPPPAMSPREPRRDGAEIAPSSREDLKDKGPATGEVLTRTRTRNRTRTRTRTRIRTRTLTRTLAPSSNSNPNPNPSPSPNPNPYANQVRAPERLLLTEAAEEALREEIGSAESAHAVRDLGEKWGELGEIGPEPLPSP